MKFSELLIRVALLAAVSIAIGLEYSAAAGAFVFVSLLLQLEAILLMRVLR